LHPHRRQAEIVAAKIVAVSLRLRDADQLAVVAIGPAVIGALEAISVARLRLTDGDRTVAAPVHEQMQSPAVIAIEDDRLPAHPAPDEIARTRYLAFMTDIDPAFM